jgi:hypothetical protein
MSPERAVLLIARLDVLKQDLVRLIAPMNVVVKQETVMR